MASHLTINVVWNRFTFQQGFTTLIIQNCLDILIAGKIALFWITLDYRFGGITL